jgi:hypothetical protein
MAPLLVPTFYVVRPLSDPSQSTTPPTPPTILYYFYILFYAVFPSAPFSVPFSYISGFAQQEFSVHKQYKSATIFTGICRLTYENQAQIAKKNRFFVQSHWFVPILMRFPGWKI